MIEPLFEAVGVVARHLGLKFAPEYLHGIAGSAFRIAGICPCAPTCSAAMSTADFAAALGFEVSRIDMGDTCCTRSDLQPLADLFVKDGRKIPEPASLADPVLREQTRLIANIIDAVKASIRQGLPAVVWHAFTTAEYDVVTGYDDESGEFFGWGSYGNPEDGSYAHAPQGRMIETAYVGGLPNAILLSGSPRDIDTRGIEIAALRDAVKHGRSRENADKLNQEKWQMLQGIACYQRWAADWGKPDKKRTMGDAYCYGVYSSTHKAAGRFLRDIAPKYPKAKSDLEHAAACFEAEANVLAAGRGLIWWSAPEGPDPDRNGKASTLLTEACGHYSDGILAMERALGTDSSFV